MKSQNRRISRERQTVAVMIGLYCRKKHKSPDLCGECRELSNYALERLEKCPFQERKTTCARCPLHCYRPVMRENSWCDALCRSSHVVSTPSFSDISFDRGQA